MRNGHSNLRANGIEMQRQSTGPLGDGDVGATIDDPAEFIRFSVYFRLLYHCFLFIAVLLMSIPVHSPFLPQAESFGNARTKRGGPAMSGMLPYRH